MVGLTSRSGAGSERRHVPEAPGANGRSAAAKLVRSGALLLLLAICGCATPQVSTNHRHFSFQKDTFDFPNELVWEYHFDEHGKWTSARRQPPPSYSHHCFVVARSARQFFLNARFAPERPKADEITYRKLVREVVSSNPRRPLTDKIVIPGYPDLRAFSRANELLLQQECGGAWQSYFQRGHWRMMCPFSRRQQEATARRILPRLKDSEPIVIHLVRFPQLTINHAMVIFDAQESPDHIEFTTYDPNHPATPVTITFNRATRTFSLPANDYFPGGRVDIYEIYHRWNY